MELNPPERAKRILEKSIPQPINPKTVQSLDPIPIRIGCVPEHFSSPIYTLVAENPELYQLVLCPGGTGM
jgi:hypothetical protein